MHVPSISIINIHQPLITSFKTHIIPILAALQNLSPFHFQSSEMHARVFYTIIIRICNLEFNFHPSRSMHRKATSLTIFFKCPCCKQPQFTWPVLKFFFKWKNFGHQWRDIREEKPEGSSIQLTNESKSSYTFCLRESELHLIYRRIS